MNTDDMASPDGSSISSSESIKIGTLPGGHQRADWSRISSVVKLLLSATTNQTEDTPQHGQIEAGEPGLPDGSSTCNVTDIVPIGQKLHWSRLSSVMKLLLSATHNDTEPTEKNVSKDGSDKESDEYQQAIAQDTLRESAPKADWSRISSVMKLLLSATHNENEHSQDDAIGKVNQTEVAGKEQLKSLLSLMQIANTFSSNSTGRKCTDECADITTGSPREIHDVASIVSSLIHANTLANKRQGKVGDSTDAALDTESKISTIGPEESLNVASVVSSLLYANTLASKLQSAESVDMDGDVCLLKFTMLDEDYSIEIKPDEDNITEMKRCGEDRVGITPDEDLLASATVMDGGRDFKEENCKAGEYYKKHSVYLRGSMRGVNISEVKEVFENASFLP